MPVRCPDDENWRCYLTEVEGIINSRPLTYIPVGTDEPQAITPNHFLLGSSGGFKSFCEFEEEVLNINKNYKLSQHMSLIFWQRCLKKYLPTLTRRTKWYKHEKPLEVEDIIVIMDDAKQNSWEKGVILEMIRSKQDNLVWSVKVKTSSGLYVRPASKVAVLDIRQEQSKPNTSRILWKWFNLPGEHVKMMTSQL